MSRTASFVLILCTLPSLFAMAWGRKEKSITGPSYIAAVYEHVVVLNPEPHQPTSRAAALQHMSKNLDVYAVQAARAAEQGAQILVFPEDGIHGFNYSRSSIAGYMETIPDPLVEIWNPCMEPDRYNNTEVLQRLSCIARHNSLYLVANMADLQPCPLASDPSTCPPDGRWQFNTDVVFSSEGQLIARYHKHNLYFEKAFDYPPRPELITFQTPFAGRFGVIICFDLLFRDPTVTLVEQGVRQLVYPTAWMNRLPLLAAVQYQRAFSFGTQVTLLAANIRNDLLGMTGSGIFSPGSALYHHARKGTPQEGRLLVARVPVLDPLWLEQNAAQDGGQVEGRGEESDQSRPVEPGYCLTEDGSCVEAPYPSPPPFPPRSTDTFVSSMMHDPFTFTVLRDLEGELTVCDGAFCCFLQYQRLPHGGSTELYALGAFSGSHRHDRYALQICALVRCAGSERSSCGQEVEEAESKVNFRLEGKFDTQHVYPSVLVSNMVLEHPKKLEKRAGGRVALSHSGMSAGLVTACLYGRMYHLDNK